MAQVTRGRREQHPVLPGLRGAALVVVMIGALAATSAHAEDFRYVVRPGDNAWSVTDRYLLDFNYWNQLLQYNQLSASQPLRPGSVLRIPSQWLRLRSAELLVSESRGDAQVRRANSGWAPCTAGQKLVAGDRLRTGPNGSAVLDLSGAGRVLMRPGSEIEVVRAEQVRRGTGLTLLVQLVSGGIESAVEHQPDSGTRFEIRTPAGVAAVRGTEFRVSTDDRGTRTEVLRGLVGLANERTRVDVPRGTGSHTERGHGPRPPVALLRAPDLGSLPTRYERLPISADLRRVAGATGYRTQLMPIDSSAIASDEASASPHARVRDVPDGEYEMRVRATDRNGLEGLQGTRRIVVDARPEPPVLTDPPADHQGDLRQRSFGWMQVPQPKASYRFQMGTDRQFAQPLVDQTVDRNSLTLDSIRLEPGRYWWRVATRTPHEGQGPFSDPQSLTLVPEPPAVEKPAQTDRSLNLRWQQGKPGSVHEIQLARDDRFEDRVLERRLPESAVTIDLPPPGNYHFRARTITPDGFAGSWSGVQRIQVAGHKPLWPLWLILIPVVLSL